MESENSRLIRSSERPTATLWFYAVGAIFVVVTLVVVIGVGVADGSQAFGTPDFSYGYEARFQAAGGLR